MWRVHKQRILCVDDDVLGTTMIAEILKEHGFSVVVFHSPLEVTRCDLSMFNLAILDFEEKRQGMSISDARNSIGLSKAMQLVAFNAA